MQKRLTFLAVLSLLMVGTVGAEIIQIPATEDAYLNMEDETVYSDSDTLRCEIDVTEVQGKNVSSYPGVPIIKFNISSLNITEEDIAILVLKAASVEMGNESVMMAMMPMASEWDEKSDYIEMVFNLLPIWNMVKNNDVSQMGINTDSDSVFAFDVSKKLNEAKAEGDNASFLLLAISNTTYRVDFMSRETSQGPYLIVMPYPLEEMEDLTSIMPVNVSMINESVASESMINESMPDQIDGSQILEVAENVTKDANLT